MKSLLPAPLAALADSPRAKNAGPVFSTTGRRDIEEARVPSFCVDELGVTVDSRAAAKFFDVPHVEITYRCANSPPLPIVLPTVTRGMPSTAWGVSGSRASSKG